MGYYSFRRKILKRNKVLLLLSIFFLFAFVPAIQSQEKAPVFTIEVDAIINPATAKFILDSIDEATQQGAQCLIIKLDTPGGLLESTRIIVKKELASTIPIIVYVAPGGARAASAGVFVTMAAHLAVMAPGTHIGAAHPVTMGGEGKESKTMTEKIVNDTVAFIKNIAKIRGRNVDWAEKAVTKSVSITEEEAVKLNVVDLIAPDIPTLLDKVDGRVIKFDGVARTLHTKGVQPQAIEMSWRDRLLDIISNPTIAYILLMLGIYGIFFELSSPGAISARGGGRNLPYSCILRITDASGQLRRFGIDLFCHHSLYCGDKSHESWIVSGRWRHLSFLRFHDVISKSGRIYEGFSECDYTRSPGQRSILHFCSNQGHQCSLEKTDHRDGRPYRRSRNRFHTDCP